MNNKQGGLSYYEKTYGTILRDHPDIDAMARQFYTLTYKDIDISRTLPQEFLYGDFLNRNVSKKYKLSKILPKNFPGQSIWSDYVTLNEFMGLCGDSWATALVQAMCDRYVIFSIAQIDSLLSATEIVMCGNIRRPRMLPGIKSQENMPMTNVCAGYSVYDAAKYIYQNGITESYCFSKVELLENGYMQPSDFKDESALKEKYPSCKVFLGNDLTHCLNPNRARRIFKLDYLINIAPDEKYTTIKYEIYKYGPVVGSFLLYKDFLDNYDGVSVYMGPPAGSKDHLGGLSVKIMGWGYDQDRNIEYWECANIWSSIWGNNGCFRIKMGIRECMLEENVVSPIISLPGIYIPLSVKPTIPPDWLSKTPPYVDVKTFYSLETIQAIKEGKVRGSLKPVLNPVYLPNYETFWACDVDSYLDGMVVKLQNRTKQNIIFGIVIVIIAVLCGYYINKLVQKKVKVI
jgi:hypothetical protein